MSWRGPEPEPSIGGGGWRRVRFPLPHYRCTRWLFPRLLAAIYLIAFLSWEVQYDGLVGAQGIMPVERLLAGIQAYEVKEGRSLLAEYPTLLRWLPGDAAAHALLWTFAALSVLVMAGIAQRWLLLLLWAGYLSFVVTGDVFIGFQWDSLLLEAGLLAVWMAPGRLWQGRGPAAPPRGSVFLLHWLLFRLMFLSGLVKLGGGDPVWRDLTALSWHYETQPLPHALAWWAHHLPAWVHAVSCGFMHGVELVLPWCLWLGRWGRLGACAGFTTLMLGVMATGNYNFFNLLTLVLALTLLDDSWWPATLRRWVLGRGPLPAPAPVVESGAVESDPLPPSPEGALAPPATAASSGEGIVGRSATRHGLRIAAAGAMVAVVVLLTLLAADSFCGQRIAAYRALVPAGVQRALYGPVAGLRSFNAYGLFQDMTTERPEVVVEVSDDGFFWVPLEFRWKPGDPMRAPRFVAPHQPRLDWQMWFAALQGGYDPRQPQSAASLAWFGEFLGCLLQKKPAVWALLEPPPIPLEKITHIRAKLYRYHFTTPGERRESGAWWRRENLGPFSPEFSFRR